MADNGKEKLPFARFLRRAARCHVDKIWNARPRTSCPSITNIVPRGLAEWRLFNDKGVCRGFVSAIWDRWSTTAEDYACARPSSHL